MINHIFQYDSWYCLQNVVPFYLEVVGSFSVSSLELFLLRACTFLFSGDVSRSRGNLLNKHYERVTVECNGENK